MYGYVRCRYATLDLSFHVEPSQLVQLHSCQSQWGNVHLAPLRGAAWLQGILVSLIALPLLEVAPNWLLRQTGSRCITGFGLLEQQSPDLATVAETVAK